MSTRQKLHDEIRVTADLCTSLSYWRKYTKGCTRADEVDRWLVDRLLSRMQDLAYALDVDKKKVRNPPNTNKD